MVTANTTIDLRLCIIIIITSLGSMEDAKVKPEEVEVDGKEDAVVPPKKTSAGIPQKEDYDFPSTLEGFKYEFNEEGQLRHIESGEGFSFKVRDEHQYNQKRYEAIGELITLHVYDLLEKECDLQRVHLPIDADEEEPRSFIFMSKDALTNPDKLLILIHGSGVVRAGQWARRLIINDCLDSGTQLPFIKKAMTEGYGVMVLNTNLNRVQDEDGKMKFIRHNSSPEEHAEYVWENYVTKAAAKHVAIIAHSYGGIVTTHLAMTFPSVFEERVFAIAFTDSVHSLQHQDCPESTMLLFEKIAQNWVSSDEPLDTPVPNFGRDCAMVSAGHPKHENTSWSSFRSIFKYLTEKDGEGSGDKDEAANKEEL